ncbi:hypothetical protein [Streptomyces sp. NPDC047841]|uniref:hypothetical protein n=1 Tax=Streptomyces sp. NPDC047841 TaxID=3154708 RepID=UPI00345543E6
MANPRQNGRGCLVRAPVVWPMPLTVAVPAPAAAPIALTCLTHELRPPAPVTHCSERKHSYGSAQRPKPDDPPKECWYYHDGHTVGRFDIGDTPDEAMAFLLPAFEEAGLLDDDVREEFDSLHATLAALQQHFGLSLPRQEVMNGRLPAAVTAIVLPEKRSWVSRSRTSVRNPGRAPSVAYPPA